MMQLNKYFSFAERLKSVEDLANPCSSSSRGSCFKESVNNNKSDTTKLSAEPLPMKRKKKGGGYNLRNSLAWDRAFFTEEGWDIQFTEKPSMGYTIYGKVYYIPFYYSTWIVVFSWKRNYKASLLVRSSGVLDPIELSTISGTSCGEGLFAIDEEISSGSCYPMESADTPAIGNDLIKEPPTGALVKYRSDCPSPKPNSSAPNDVISTSMVSFLLSIHNLFFDK